MGSLLGSNDFARVDTGIIAQWAEQFGDRKIDQITVEETVAGIKTRLQVQTYEGFGSRGQRGYSVAR